MQPRPHQRQDAELAEPNPLYFRYSQIQAGNACLATATPGGSSA
jgi:hypothetical protein